MNKQNNRKEGIRSNDPCEICASETNIIKTKFGNIKIYVKNV